MRTFQSLHGLFALTAGILFSLNMAPAGRAARAADVRRLEPGVSVEREIARGDEHHYQVVLAAGQLVGFNIVKQGMNITSTLKGPDGEEIFAVHFEVREHGVQEFSLVAQTAGPHTLIVRPRYGRSHPGRYEIKIDEPREPSEQDRQRFAAQQAFLKGDSLFQQGTGAARRESVKKFSESLRLWQSVGAAAWEARALLLIGWSHYWLEEYDAALTHFNRALEIRRAIGDTFGEAEALCGIGSTYIYKEENQKAIEVLGQALIIQLSLDERWHLASIFYELGGAYWNLYEIEKVEHYYSQSVERYREVDDRSNEATVLASLGTLQMMQGDLQSALDNTQRSLVLYRAEKNGYGEGAALHHLGDIYYNLGEPQTALDHYKQSLPFFDQSGYLYPKAYVLTSMGGLYSSMENHQEALEHLNKALPISRALQNRRGEAGTLLYLGRAYRKIGDLPKALEHLNQSLRINQELRDPSNQAGALTAIGEIYAAMGDYQKAREYLDRALELMRAIAYRRGEAVTLYALAGIERARGRLSEAQAKVEEAIHIIESLRSKVVGIELRTSYFSAQQGSYELYIDLLMSLHEKSPGAGYDALALQASEKGRARALLESLVEARADIHQGVDKALLERERFLRQQLNAKDERRIRMLSGGHTREDAAVEREVNALLAEYQQVQARIRSTSPRYAAITQPQPLALKEIQAQLDRETVLLVYSLGEKRSFLWAVTPATVNSYVLPARDQIESKARGLYSLLQSDQYEHRGRIKVDTGELSGMLLGRAAGHLAGKRLVIVADGALQSIPFAALYEPGSRRPLIINHEIVSLPSVSVLGQQRREMAGRKTPPNTLMVIADPVFEPEDERFKTGADRVESPSTNQADPLRDVVRAAGDAGLNGFPRLIFSRREADQISSFVPSAMCSKIMDFDASRAKLAETNLSRYRILHFATHSLINHKNPELSGIVLSLYDEKRRPQDGFLRSHELYNLKLESDLVVLSACRTALGKEVRGEGLVGMTRGFMYAGAARLVVSLWNVNDEATAELMRRFYQGMLQKNLSPAAALRAAQAAMAKEPDWSEPYYWAGFTLQGEWR